MVRTLAEVLEFVAVDIGEGAIRRIIDSIISMLTKVLGITGLSH